jgi:hypothetical protein
MRKFLEKLKVLFNWKGLEKRKLKKQRRKRGRGYSSTEAFHAHFAERYGKPGRVPDDVA